MTCGREPDGLKARQQSWNSQFVLAGGQYETDPIFTILTEASEGGPGNNDQKEDNVAERAKTIGQPPTT